MWKIASLFWLLVGLGVSDAFGRTSPIGQKGRVWEIRTKTSNEGHGGTDANVHIILIGPDGRKSPPIFLGTTFFDNFERNSEDHFSVYDTVFLSDVCAITIYRDNSGDDPNWLLEKVWIKAAHMKNDRVFNINRWVPTEQEERASHYEVQRSPPCSAGHLP